MRKNRFFLLSLCLLFTVISFYRLDDIPGEWFGDINIVHDYVSRVLKGEWPHYFEAGAGPAYHYMIAPFIRVLGMHYYDYKIMSVATGFLGVIALYLLAKELTNKRLALLASGICSFTYWFLIWNRIGNYNIIIFFYSTFSLYSAISFNKYRRWKYLISGSVISSLGLLTHPSAYILPTVYFLLVIYGLINKKNKRDLRKVLPVMLLFYLPATVIFFISF